LLLSGRSYTRRERGACKGTTYGTRPGNGTRRNKRPSAKGKKKSPHVRGATPHHVVPTRTGVGLKRYVSAKDPTGPEPNRVLDPKGLKEGPRMERRDLRDPGHPFHPVFHVRHVVAGWPKEGRAGMEDGGTNERRKKKKKQRAGQKSTARTKIMGQSCSDRQGVDSLPWLIE